MVPQDKRCFQLKPPSDVAAALETCFYRAVNVDYRCRTYDEMRKTFVQKSSLELKMFKFIKEYFEWTFLFSQGYTFEPISALTYGIRQNMKNTFSTCILNLLGANNTISKYRTKELISRYEGDETNKTAIINAIDDCMEIKSHEEFSNCVILKLIESPCNGPDKAVLRKFSFHCKDCFTFTTSDKVKNEIDHCGKLLGVINYEDEVKKCHLAVNIPNFAPPVGSDNQWLHFFVDNVSPLMYVTEKTQTKIENCVIKRLAMGTRQEVRPEGYIRLITDHLTGEKFSKSFLVKSVKDCTANSPTSVKSFRKCMKRRMSLKCDEE